MFVYIRRFVNVYVRQLDAVARNKRQLWAKIEQLPDALDAFTPRTPSRQFKLWPREEELSEDTPTESFMALCRQVFWLISLGHNSGTINTRIGRALRDLIMATTDSYWLLTELRTRTDPPAQTLYALLRSM